MNFTSQICTTKEQSERLLALGLKTETADMYATDMSSKGINYTDDWKIGSIPYCNAISFLNGQGLQLEKTAWSIIPAWSLHRLIELCAIPKVPFIRMQFQNTYDEIISLIAEAIKWDAFNKEYLEE